MPVSQRCMRGCQEVFQGDSVKDVADQHEEHLRDVHSDVAFVKEREAASETYKKEQESELAQKTVNMLAQIADMSAKLEYEQGKVRNEINVNNSRHRLKELEIPKWGKTQGYKQWKEEYGDWKLMTMADIGEEDSKKKVGETRVRLKLLEMLKTVENEKVKEYVEKSVINNDQVNRDESKIIEKLDDRFGVS